MFADQWYRFSILWQAQPIEKGRQCSQPSERYGLRLKDWLKRIKRITTLRTSSRLVHSISSCFKATSDFAKDFVIMLSDGLRKNFFQFWIEYEAQNLFFDDPHCGGYGFVQRR